MRIQNVRVQKISAQGKDRNRKKENRPIVAEIKRVRDAFLFAGNQDEYGYAARKRGDDRGKDLRKQSKSDKQREQGGEPCEHQKSRGKSEPDPVFCFVRLKHDLGDTDPRDREQQCKTDGSHYFVINRMPVVFGPQCAQIVALACVMWISLNG